MAFLLAGAGPAEPAGLILSAAEVGRRRLLLDARRFAAGAQLRQWLQSRKTGQR